MFLDAGHRHHGVGIAPSAVLLELFQQRHLKIGAGGRMHDDLAAILDDIAEGVAARAQQVAILFVVGRGEGGGLLQQAVGHAAWRIADRLREFLAMTQRQFPRKLFGRAVAILAFDFDLRQRGARNIAVAVHIDGGMAVLA